MDRRLTGTFRGASAQDIEASRTPKHVKRPPHIHGSYGAMKKRKEVFQFKITLAGVAPVVWRRIQVPHTYTFWDLHVAILGKRLITYHPHIAPRRIKNGNCPSRTRKPAHTGDAG